MNYYSQFSEDALADGLFRKIGTNNKWCFEVGAADGIWLSNTRGFIERGWKSILVESDPDKFAKLKKNTPTGHCFNETVAIDKKIDDILDQTPAPQDIDLVSIDIDGQDYYVWKDLNKYRPRIVVVEWSPYVSRDYLPEPDTDGKEGKNQAGLDVMIKLASDKGYTVIAITYCNLICVPKEILGIKRIA
jgi:hypothetical protein